jgi:hypothetical protein
MKRIILLLLLPLLAHAHVGSPNVFFEGQAGPHAVRVIIRPPNALPGIAQVDVRIAGEGVTRVSVQPTFWDAGGEAAPTPIPATAVAGDAHLFNAACWLLRRGSYAVRITVENDSVVVPLQAASLQRPDMPPALGATLVTLGAILFLGAVWLAHAAAHARAAVITALLLAGAIGGGTVRWQKMDREFRNNALARPLPVVATIRTEGTLHLLHLTPSAEAPVTSGWETLAADHGKLIHLFLAREPDFTAFAHLHPVRRDGRNFEGVLPPLPAGTYQLYAEVTHENGANETLTANVTLPAPLGAAAQAGWDMKNEVWCQSPIPREANSAQPFALDADDSWHVGPAPAPDLTLRTQVSRLMGGSTMVFQNAGDLVANRDTSLRFAVFTPTGEAAALQPYMGMTGHAVVRRSDGAVFTHLHPLGTISMAAQQIFTGPASPPAPAPSVTHEVTFPYAFPRAGDYRAWTQVRVQGRVVTGVFDVRVRER